MDGNQFRTLGALSSALKKIRALLWIEDVDLILAQGPDVICARLHAFMLFESTLKLGRYTITWHWLCLIGMV